MKLLDYERQTTFWQDFSIAKKYWGKDKIYGTELSMVLNHKCWFHYELQNEEISQLYSESWTEYHDWALDNWKGKNLAYYLRITD